MAWRCIGCDGEIGWNGKGTLCYTCPCGGHIFYNDQTMEPAFPSSVILALFKKTDLPHLDYLIGKSDFTSPVKDKLIEQLRSAGAIWMKECPQCLADGTYQRTLAREKEEAVFYAEMIVKSAAKENES